jgi:hypothetical protein
LLVNFQNDCTLGYPFLRRHITYVEYITDILDINPLSIALKRELRLNMNILVEQNICTIFWGGWKIIGWAVTIICFALIVIIDICCSHDKDKAALIEIYKKTQRDNDI